MVSQIKINKYLLVLELLLIVQLIKIKGIEDGYYYHNHIPCAKCPRGYKIKYHCNSQYQQSECVPCEEGTFAASLSSSKLCGKCKDCRHTDQIIKKNCTLVTNTECQCPDKKYFDSFCRNCFPPKIKKVRDETEYCEPCDCGSYYNYTVEDCIKCDVCTEDQAAIHVCNETHNTQCIHLPRYYCPEDGGMGAGCECGSYYNYKVEECVKCDVCREDQVTLQFCNATHNTKCIELPTPKECKTGENEDSLSGGEIAGIIISILVVLTVAATVLLILKKRKMWCFRDRSGAPNNTTNDTDSRAPENDLLTQNAECTSSV